MPTYTASINKTWSRDQMYCDWESLGVFPNRSEAVIALHSALDRRFPGQWEPNGESVSNALRETSTTVQWIHRQGRAGDMIIGKIVSHWSDDEMKQQRVAHLKAVISKAREELSELEYHAKRR